MKKMQAILRRWFGNNKSEEPSENIDQLRVAFQERYHNFKLLLSANNRSLEVMAEMELALQGTRPFGMSFIRSSSTLVSVNVFRMIQNLKSLAPEKYIELDSRYSAIQQVIDSILKAEKPLIDGDSVLNLRDLNAEMFDAAGNKMANLGELKNRVGLLVPDGFVLTTTAYRRFIDHNQLQIEIDRLFQSAELGSLETRYSLSSRLQQLIIRSEIPKDIVDAISRCWKEIETAEGNSITMALRSSAIGEDAEGSSFAGQYRSELNVSFENALQAYKEVVASKYSLTAMTYRLNKGFRDRDILMSVGFLKMVDAISGGVMYSRNPVDDQDDSILINSVWGLPKSVVDGSISCDVFFVGRGTNLRVIEQNISSKTIKYVCYPQEGVCRQELLPEESLEPSITDSQILSLAEVALAIEAHYGMPQDIEWAIDASGEIFILQCRPLEQIHTPKEENPEKPPVFWEEKQLLFRGGVTASPGISTGTVFPVVRGVDVLEFPDGAILIASQALPRWASLMNQASAVITEQGGFAGHLANVAREFRIPALFGVPNALSLFSKGQRITVDATHRVIWEGEVASILNREVKKTNAMAGSPVYKILKTVSDHIVPLHLLDPDSIDFQPVKCRTFHDITRFIHEKSVTEMFNFGRDHHFPERSSKQLHYRVPMQWWVLNLDDGFTEEVDGKYIRLEQIQSIPMQAFWKGFVAIPWDGPPALDRKGFMSVMFQSTTNTALVSGVKSAFAERNYFMISKNFCSLSSRLGYHFSTLESLISDRISENYTSFQFKGGAADDTRRLKRVQFIGDILEEQGFRVEIRDDHLSSRIEQQNMEYMILHVEILGYLTLHTRQLDMIMTNPSSVAYYRKKIQSDIETLKEKALS
ncbi:MAG: PEP/pyruvate-binding domain-containing protein [Desulfatirhabdiaceae bacterium]